MSAEPIPFPAATRSEPAPVSLPGGPVAAELLGVDGGALRVRLPDGQETDCLALQLSAVPLPLRPGDRVMVLPVAGAGAVVVGRLVGVGDEARVPEVLELVAAEALNLRCGAGQMAMRADGRVMVRGEDVLLRAAGTQRIRAGTVAIN